MFCQSPFKALSEDSMTHNLPTTSGGVAPDALSLAPDCNLSQLFTIPFLTASPTSTCYTPTAHKGTLPEEKGRPDIARSLHLHSLRLAGSARTMVDLSLSKDYLARTTYHHSSSPRNICANMSFDAFVLTSNTGSSCPPLAPPAPPLMSRRPGQ